MQGVIEPLWNDVLNMPDHGDYITNRLVMQEKYELALGVLTEKDIGPAACCTMKPTTSPISHSMLSGTYEALIKNRVPELTQMTITQLMDMPTYELKILIDTIKNIHEKEKAAAEAAKKKKNINR